MMKELKSHSVSGFTYIELLICMLIMTIVIGPICMSIINANKVRITAESLDESTMYTEALLEAIKQQLTQDIDFQKQKESNLNTVGQVSDKIKESITLCLEQEYRDVAPLKQMPLTDFFWNKETGTVDEQLMRQLYGSERYAYEVAIWRSGNIDLSEEITDLVFNQPTLKRAAKFYSNPEYCFNTYEDSRQLVLKISQDLRASMERKSWNQDKEKGYQIIDENTIILTESGLKAVGGKLNDSSEITSTANKDEVTIAPPQIIKDASGLIGLVYTSTSEKNYTPQDMNVLYLDIRQLKGKIHLYHNLTLKFINQTNMHQIIRVIKHKEQDKINIIPVNKGEQSGTSIEYIDTLGLTENFIIAIITRDMKPIVGKPGKIVKKMIDIYSYS